MAEVWGKTHDIRLEEAHSKIKDAVDDSLRNSLNLIDDKLKIPQEITVATSIITISASSVQTLKSAETVEGTSNSIKRDISPLGGNVISLAASTLDVSNGNVTGDFQTSPGCPTVTANEYIYLGFEIQADSKIYLVWGASSNSNPTLAPKPVYTTSAVPIGFILLQKNGSTGTWNFVNPVDTNITQFYSGGGGGGGSGSSGFVSIHLIDTQNTTKPATTATTIDSETVLNDDLVLFTNLSVGGDNQRVYKAAVSGGNITWTLQALGKNIDGSPTRGDGYYVIRGAIDFNTIWFYSVDDVFVEYLGGDISSGFGIEWMLTAEELNQFYSLSPNTFVDDFQTDKGTKSNTQILTNALRLTVGQNSGTYERSLETTTRVSKIEGIAVSSIQALAPKNTAIVSNTIYFYKDVTEYFPTSTDVVVFKEITSDGMKRHIFLTNNGENVARLPVSSCSYSSVNDETTLVLTNSESLDLTMGFSSSEYYDKLRIEPFDYAFQVKTSSGGTYETMDFDDAHAYEYPSGPVCRMPGESFVRDGQDTLTGTTKRSSTVFSKNKTYGIRALLENRTTNDVLVLEYTVDRDKTWAKLGEVTLSLGNGANDAWVSQFCRSMIFVADNGKYALCYVKHPSSYDDSMGKYGNLNTPTFLDTPTTGSGAGILYTGANTRPQVSGDPVDGSFFAFTYRRTDTTAHHIDTFNNSGATYLGRATSSFAQLAAGNMMALKVSGSGTTHTVHHVVRRSSDSYLCAGRVTEAAPTTFTSESAITATSTYLIDAFINDTYLVLLYANSSDLTRYMYKTLASNTWSSNYVVSGELLNDLRNGAGVSDVYTLLKSQDMRIKSNPSDDKHVIFCFDATYGDNDSRGYIIEIKDITAYVGASITQVVGETNGPHRSTSSYTWLAQTFTAATTKITTIAVNLYQVGTISTGKNIWVEIYDTSGGVPTTLVSSAVSQNIDPSNITKNTSWQVAYFNIPSSVSLSIGSVYAIVLKGDYDISGSNYLTVRGTSTNPYAGGSWYNWNGSTWSIASGYDFWFIIYDNFLNTVGEGSDYPCNTKNVKKWHSESCIEWKDSNNLIYLTRDCPNLGDTSLLPFLGYPYFRNIIISSNNPAIGAYTQVAYRELDSNIVFNVALGSLECYGKNLLTGASEGEGAHLRMSYIMHSGITNSNSVTYPADSDFESGYCGSFSTTSRLAYTTLSVYYTRQIGNMAANDFRKEFELKLVNAHGAKRMILCCFGSAREYQLYINSSGYLTLSYYNGSTTLYKTASDKVEPLIYYRMAVTRTAGIIKFWRAETLPYTTFTEVASYSSSTADSQTFGTFDAAWSLGYTSDSLNGKMGYVKIGIGSDTFVNNGFISQPVIYNVENHGFSFSGEQQIGATSGVSNSQFDTMVIMDGSTSSIVDSYDQLIKHKKTIDVPGKNPYFKLTMNRGGSQNQSSYQGLIYQLTK